jgi:hypothetical protein
MKKYEKLLETGNIVEKNIKPYKWELLEHVEPVPPELPGHFVTQTA